MQNVNTVKVKTNELTNQALDWAVAKCEGFDSKLYEKKRIALIDKNRNTLLREYSPSTDWAQGGPIIERECMNVSALFAQKNPPSPEFAHSEWWSHIPHGTNSVAVCAGPTPLIAAMRCYVKSKLGETVDIPVELL